MKATFQKPDATYTHGSLRPIWETKPPERKYFVTDGKFDDIQYMWACKDYAYEQEKRCQPIPCSENNWKDGQELEEGKDYEIVKQILDFSIKEISLNKGGKAEIGGDIIKYNLVAVPIVQETEDTQWQLWNELINKLSLHLEEEKIYWRDIEEARKLFLIQRRKQ